MDDFDLNAPQAATGNGLCEEEDPAAAFLAQQESEIAGIENDEGFSILDSGEIPSSLSNLTGDPNQDLNDANSRKLEAEWKEKAKIDLEEWYCRQDEQLEKTKVNNRVQDEAFYRQPFADLIGYVIITKHQVTSQKDYLRISSQTVSVSYTDHTNINHPCYRLEQEAEEALVTDLDENNPGTEWERVARLCDFNPKSSKQAKDVSRMRSVLISLKTSPLVH
ncbi:clathrin light chain A-like isoform X4 [Polyodon spathula]|uniref:clathrin light chain A-like isoform X4 n=1 Tax=Polyodon spathula TaxID=7913 RepID=UPI001B7E0F46|nr:clathrin light chain A-like isoform X4 [Polyodon spathula]